MKVRAGGFREKGLIGNQRRPARARMRSCACDTASRLCVRTVLCSSAFLSVPLLPSTGSSRSAEFSFLLSLLCTTETRHDERHKCALMARSLVCSVALSGQAPKPHSGAPQARGLTANARTEQTSVLPRCAPTIGRSQSCRRSFFSAPAKLGSIYPHAMHDDRQPSRHSDDCALHPTMPGNLHAPGLEPRPASSTVGRNSRFWD